MPCFSSNLARCHIRLVCSFNFSTLFKDKNKPPNKINNSVEKRISELWKARPDLSSPN